MQKHFLGLAMLAATLNVHALTVTQWDFNAKTLAPSIGTGSLSLIGGVTLDPAYGNGNANGGSSDPVTTGDFGLQTLTYGNATKANKTSGITLAIDTTGYTNLVFSYDLRHSNTSSRYEQVQYSIDGINFVDAASFSGNAGDTWFNQRSVDLSGVAGVADNENFALRVVSAYAPGTSSYLASNSSSTYASTGTWRFDMVTVSGAVIAPVPEPESYALMLAGLIAVGFMASRRRAG